MSIKKTGPDFKSVNSPDYCEQALLLNKTDSYLVKFDEYTQDRDSYVVWYTPAGGPCHGGEMSDTVYCKDDVIPYHEHNKGVELFLIDEGSVLVSGRGIQAVANKGDLVFIPPSTSHAFKFLEEGTIWREWFQDIKMNEGLLAQRRFRTYGDASLASAHFDQKIARRLGTYWYGWEPVLRDVAKSEMYLIRDFDFAYETFRFPGIQMLQKVQRYEMNGTIEFWQYRLDKNFQFSWNMWNDHGILMPVFSGSVEVNVPGHAPFVARKHDIINIPSYLQGELTALEDNTVLYDYGCRGYLFRALEHIKALESSAPAKLKDDAYIEKLLEEQYDVFTRGKLLK